MVGGHAGVTEFSTEGWESLAFYSRHQGNPENVIDSLQPLRIKRTPELLRRFGDGDEEAYRTLYDRYRSPLLGFIRNHMDEALRRAVSEDDLLQETHLEALGALHRFTYRRDLAFFFWLCGIARRRIHHHCRRLRRLPPPLSLYHRRAGSVSSSDLLRTLASAGQDPFEDLSFRQHLDLLASAIESLREKDRCAVVLCYVEGLSGPEAAAAIGVSPGAFRVRLSRALVRLRGVFDDLLRPPAQVPVP
jgi:RNA polymerase sigma-70 factor, ECF subfamily